MAKLFWTQKQDIGPSARFNHAMVFDAARQRVVLFGGDTLGGRLKDTWHWDGSDWTQLEDIGPAARSGHAMAFDSVRGRIVLFGGTNGNNDFGDTWEWDGESWTQLQDAGPSARSGHAMVFDVARQRVLLFGGGPNAGTALADTWEWDGEDWSQVEDAGPPARRGHSMAYDVTRNRTVLFGGLGTAGPDGLADTWEWNGSAWTQVEDIGPAGCFGAALVFKSSTSALFGGQSGLGLNPPPVLSGLTWEWNGRHWTARQDIGVGARMGHAMAFDSVRGRVVLFGGLTVPFDQNAPASALRGDTWEHPDSAVPQGTGPSLVQVAGLSVQPDTVQSGVETTVTFEVQLAAPAPGNGAQVEIGGDFGDLGPIAFGAGEAAGAMQIQIPANIADMVPVPFAATITATSANSVSATLTII